MNIVINTLRWIVFIPVSLILLYLISLGMDWIAISALSLSRFWFTIVMVAGGLIGGGILFSILQVVNALVWGIAPNHKTAAIIFSLLVMGLLVSALIDWWKEDITTVHKLFISVFYLVNFGAMAASGFAFSKSEH